MLKFITVSLYDRKLISEGYDVEIVLEKAKKSNKDFIMKYEYKNKIWKLT